jgi:hypothetical protein
LRQQKTFEAISRALEDGTWHRLDDLRDVTRWPEEWTRELEAEGLLDTEEQLGSVLVRLRDPAPSSA